MRKVLSLPAPGNGVMNSSEAPLAGAPVILYNTSAGNSSVTVYTDSTGYFEYCGPFVGTSNVILAQVSPTWLIYNGYTALTTYLTLMGTTTGQISNGSRSIFGVMVESHINGGAQKFTPGVDSLSGLEYGKSITDACINWDDSVAVLETLSNAVKVRRNK